MITNQISNWEGRNLTWPHELILISSLSTYLVSWDKYVYPARHQFEDTSSSYWVMYLIYPIIVRSQRKIIYNKRLYGLHFRNINQIGSLHKTWRGETPSPSSHFQLVLGKWYMYMVLFWTLKWHLMKAMAYGMTGNSVVCSTANPG